MQSRAFFLGSLTALVAAPALAADALATLERHAGGRLGVAAIDTRSGQTLEHRAHEPFPLASTFKLPLVMAILARVDAGTERLDRALPYGRRDLLAYAPVTSAHVAEGRMSIGALCSAAITFSDNTAANLLLPYAGGPAGVTRYARAHGAAAFRLDHGEPAVNGDDPHDAHDRTSPAAMAALMVSLTRGNALHPPSTARLLGWMRAATTGDARFRAGVPAGWRVADKTGTTAHVSNDVGILWPPNRTPIVVVAYCDAPAASGDARDTALASCARVVAERLG